jgi:hypothetical protein
MQPLGDRSVTLVERCPVDAHDRREQANRAEAEPQLLAELQASRERTNAGPLPYPTGS